jgi:hypothetical protein
VFKCVSKIVSKRDTNKMSMSMRDKREINPNVNDFLIGCDINTSTLTRLPTMPKLTITTNTMTIPFLVYALSTESKKSLLFRNIFEVYSIFDVLLNHFVVVYKKNSYVLN